MPDRLAARVTTSLEHVQLPSAEQIWRLLDVMDVGLLITDPARRIIYVNATFTRESGYTLDEVHGHTCAVLQGPATDPADIEAMRQALDQGEGFSRVVLNYRKDGRPIRYRVRVQPLYEGGILRYFVGIQEDYSETYAALERLGRWAHVDSLTGLGNRRAFDRALDQALADRTGVQLVLLDLNDFKQVNDERGHQAGDQLLVEVAQALTGVLDGEGSAYRLGGDEFAALLPPAAAPVDERLREALAALETEAVRAAVGVARAPDEARTAPALFRLADSRMYRQKVGTRS
ncbi:sensor domain-containing diguanylate cyclase [Deinococcus kurensis]|uniref:sensor domain-containing diguanylate cyclase n=1 Tax=Deinococcus kurensis TaxID=2662757 RepID=UPI0012D2EA47|nr:GGDEF domain-containing protein [Deinococcus kurensis]